MSNQSINCVRCSRNIGRGESYFADDQGRPVCPSCHESGKRPCAGCANPILPSVKVTRKFEGGEYHTDCFRCTACQGTLKTPIRGPDRKLYCNECGQPCHRCHNLLKNGKFMEMNDQRYHMDCFVCSKCGTKLGEEVFLLDQEIGCKQCAGA